MAIYSFYISPLFQKDPKGLVSTSCSQYEGGAVNPEGVTSISQRQTRK